MKSEFRKQILSARKAMTQDEVETKSAQILSRLMESSLLEQAEVILCYMDFRNEVQTGAIIEYLWSLGKIVALPRVNPLTKRLDLYRVDGFREMVTGSLGIMEPDTSLPQLLPEDIDLVLAPGVAFDEKGGRMGYGGGFYDRLIPTLRPDCQVIALAFEQQVVEEIPSDSHDQSIHGILTENRLIIV